MRISDRIYGPGYFDLDAAALPSTALLRSCQRLHLESKGLFITASKAYWQKEFVINLRDNHSDAPYILNMPDQYLARIRKLTFLVRHSGFPVKASWTWSLHSWNVQIFDQSPNQDTFDAIDHENADAAVLGVKAMMLNPTIIPDGVSQYQPYNLPFVERCDIEAMLHHLWNEQRAFEQMCLAASIGHVHTGRLVEYYLDISAL